MPFNRLCKPLDLRRRAKTVIIAYHRAGRRIRLQPLRGRNFEVGDPLEQRVVNLLLDLRRVAPINQHGCLFFKDDGEPRRAGEGCEPGKPLLGGRYVLALVLIGERHQETLHAKPGQLGAERGDTLGRPCLVRGFGEGLELRFEHGGAFQRCILRAAQPSRSIRETSRKPCAR